MILGEGEGMLTLPVQGPGFAPSLGSFLGVANRAGRPSAKGSHSVSSILRKVGGPHPWGTGPRGDQGNDWELTALWGETGERP